MANATANPNPNPNPNDRVNAAISDVELERRWAAVRAAMAERKIDALLMQANNDFMGGYVKYFTDLPATNGYPVTVVFPREERMTVVGPAHGRKQFAACVNVVEARHRPRRRTDAGDAHSQRLALGREFGRNEAHAEDCDGLALEQAGRDLPLPQVLLLVAHVACGVPGKREHGQQRGLGYRAAMKAVQVGDDDVLAQCRAVGDAVDARAQCLDPFEPGGFFQHMFGHHRPEGHQHIGIGDIRVDPGVMVDEIDRDVRKARPDAVVILLAHRFGQGEENEQLGHCCVSCFALRAGGGRDGLFSNKFMFR